MTVHAFYLPVVLFTTIFHSTGRVESLGYKENATARQQVIVVVTDHVHRSDRVALRIISVKSEIERAFVEAYGCREMAHLVHHYRANPSACHTRF